MRAALEFRTVVMSDVHLGTAHCQARAANRFLRHVRCGRLILNGDIVDGWALRRRPGHWRRAHTRFLREVLRQIEKHRTEVIYLRGNHDDLLARVLPLELGGLRVAEDFVHDGPAGRYLCLHGDVFDTVTQHLRFLAELGDIGYQLLLRVNRAYNAWREWRGLEYYSLAKAIKARVKRAVSRASDFEAHLAALARRRGCDGVICGHIHTPADKRLGEIHYLNSGDWVESLTALVEHPDGRWEVLAFAEFGRRLAALPTPPEAAAGPSSSPLEAG